MWMKGLKHQGASDSLPLEISVRVRLLVTAEDCQEHHAFELCELGSVCSDGLVQTRVEIIPTAFGLGQRAETNCKSR